MPQLVRHPSSNSPRLRLEASVARAPFRVTYLIEGDLSRLRVPAPRPPRTGERLWLHTCCEIFIGRENDPGYHELNFSPSGEWAGYWFARYREGGALAVPDPEISVRRDPGRLQLEAMIRLETTGRLLIGLSAVIQDEDGALSYWALRHPPGKPDFHHREGFALPLDEIRN